MAETPDFDEIAHRIGIPGVLNGDPEQWARDIAEKLRLVWNARGAADLEKLTEAEAYASESGYRSIKELEQEIRQLDFR